MISINNLYKSYTSPEGKQEVFTDASADFPLGVISALVGSSGSGKSTLLNIIATIDSPDQGEIVYGFEDLRLSTITDKDAFRNRHIGFVFQSHNLLPEFSILENITLPAIIAGTPKKDYLDAAAELMDRCGIAQLKSKRPTQVSGGEAQRAAIARALINRPTLVLADEPTGNLDEGNSQAVLDLMLQLTQDSSMTVVIATHSKDIAGRCDRIYKVTNKKISTNPAS